MVWRGGAVFRTHVIACDSLRLALKRLPVTNRKRNQYKLQTQPSLNVIALCASKARPVYRIQTRLRMHAPLRRFRARACAACVKSTAGGTACPLAH